MTTAIDKKTQLDVDCYEAGLRFGQVDFICTVLQKLDPSKPPDAQIERFELADELRTAVDLLNRSLGRLLRQNRVDGHYRNAIRYFEQVAHRLECDADSTAAFATTFWSQFDDLFNDIVKSGDIRRSKLASLELGKCLSLGTVPKPGSKQTETFSLSSLDMKPMKLADELSVDLKQLYIPQGNQPVVTTVPQWRFPPYRGWNELEAGLLGLRTAAGQIDPSSSIVESGVKRTSASGKQGWRCDGERVFFSDQEIEIGGPRRKLLELLIKPGAQHYRDIAEEIWGSSYLKELDEKKKLDPQFDDSQRVRHLVSALRTVLRKQLGLPLTCDPIERTDEGEHLTYRLKRHLPNDAGAQRGAPRNTWQRGVYQGTFLRSNADAH